MTTPTPVTDEFLVNTHTDGFQQQATVAALPGGGFVVVWATQGPGGTAVLPGGNFFDIHAQIYDDAGNPVGTEFRVNSFTSNFQIQPAVAALEDGGFVVTWSSSGQDQAGSGIFGRRFDASGAPVGLEFDVDQDTNTDNGQQLSTVTALEGGGFLVTWTAPAQLGPTGLTPDVLGRIYDAAGTPVGGEFLLNTATANNQNFSSATALPDGGFVVTWSSEVSFSQFEIFGQRFDALGAKVGGEFQVNTTTPNRQEFPSMTALAGGGFVVTWSSVAGDGEYDIIGQRYAGFDAAGTPIPVGGEFTINTFAAGRQIFSSVTALADGGFLVVWQSRNQDSTPGGGEFGVFGQRFDATGAKVGDEFLINQTTAGDQGFQGDGGDYTVVQLASGEVVVVWQSGPVAGFTDVYARRFALPADDVTVVGSPDLLIDLSALVDVGGNLTITDNGNAVVIDLSNLATVGGNFTYDNNAAVLTVSVPVLADVGGSVDINGNTAATGIDLSSLESTGAVNINANTSATGIDLSSLTTTGAVDINGNTAVITIDLGALIEAGAVIIAGNGVVTLDLSALVSAGGDVSITGNGNLLAIDMPELTEVEGSFQASNNASMTFLTASNLGSIGGDLAVLDNASLLSLGLPSLTQVGGNVEVSDNNSLEDIDFGSLFDTERSFTIDGNSSLDSLAVDTLNQVGGDLAVTGNASLASVILPSLTQVGGDLDVSDNASALQIDIGSLQNAGSVTIGGNDAVEDIDFSGLFDVERSFDVSGNSSVESLAIAALAQVGGDFAVTGNASLPSLILPSLATVNGNLTVAGNDAMAEITILGPIAVAGDVTLEVGADGTLNTISTGDVDTGGGNVLLEASGEGATNFIAAGDSNTGGGSVNLVADGTSNTIMLGDTSTGGGDVTARTGDGVADGSSNTIMIGDTDTGGGDLNVEVNTEGTADITVGTIATGGGGVTVVADGTSNTIMIGDTDTGGGDVNVDTEGAADITVGTIATGEGDVTIAAGSDATAVDASGLGAGGGTVLLTGAADGDSSVTLGAMDDAGGVLTIIGAGGVTVTAEEGLSRLTVSGSAGDDTVTGSATAANTMDGGGGNDDLTGGADADAIAGGEGNDTLAAGDGDDTVEGEEGDDTIVGGHGGGNDVYDGGAGIDTVTYTSTTLGIVVDLAAGTASGSEIDSDTLIGIENVTGGAGSDRIGGNAAANVLAGGAGSDTAVFSGHRADYTVAAIGGAYQVTDNRAGPNDGVDIVSDFELFEFSDGTVAEADILNPPPALNVVNGTPGNDFNLDGTAGADAINGFGGHDIIDARGGGDVINAGAGTDLVFAGSGDDTVVAIVNDGHDLYHGDGGADTLDLSQTSAAATVKLGTTVFGLTIDGVGSAKSGQIGTDVLLDFENVIGGSGDDKITGDNGDNVLAGGAGNDTISGLGGSDTLSGDAGNDVLTGGFGSDTFHFKPGFGNDRIADFDANPAGGQDLIDISAFGISAADFSARVAIADIGADTLVTIDGDPAQTIRLSGIGNAANVTANDFLLA